MGNPEIKNRFNGVTIVEAGKYTDIREAVEKSRANLSRADLSRADLYGADLSGANLYGADLSRANLYGADLSGADLSGANGEKLTLLKNNPVLIIGPIGSRQAYMTAYNTDKGIYIKTGCYFDTVENFKLSVDKTHHGTKHEHDYMTAIAFVKAVMRVTP
jgi:hypothetical protein